MVIRDKVSAIRKLESAERSDKAGLYNSANMFLFEAARHLGLVLTFSDEAHRTSGKGWAISSGGQARSFGSPWEVQQVLWNLAQALNHDDITRYW